MTASFIYVFQSEWLKRKRSLASWIVLVGGIFTPVIMLIARLVQPTKLQAIYSADNFWLSHWKSAWESMAIFLLPLGVIMLASLVTQLEYKNNTWKQVHTLPLTLTTIFFAKLAVIIIMLLQFFIFFNVGIYLSGIIPALLFKNVPLPKSLPYGLFLKEDFLFFICCLPIVALQYLVSLKYKNFLVPVGVGFIIWVGALSALSWKFGYLIPYTYLMYNYLKDSGQPGKFILPVVSIYYLAVAYFILFTLAGYVFYILKKEKG